MKPQLILREVLGTSVHTIRIRIDLPNLLINPT